MSLTRTSSRPDAGKRAHHRRQPARLEARGCPMLPGLRPTPDRVRETLFNWLAPMIDGRALPRSVRRHRRAGHRGAVARRGARRFRRTRRAAGAMSARRIWRGSSRALRRVRSADALRLLASRRNGATTSSFSIRRSTRICGTRLRCGSKQRGWLSANALDLRRIAGEPTIQRCRRAGSCTAKVAPAPCAMRSIADPLSLAAVESDPEPSAILTMPKQAEYFQRPRARRGLSGHVRSDHQRPCRSGAAAPRRCSSA